MISAFNYRPTVNYGDFGEEDWWVFGWSYCNAGGYCGESPWAGEHKYDDAAEQIERRIRIAIGVPAQRHYPTDVTTLEIWPDGLVRDRATDILYYCDFLYYQDETPEDNYYDYLGFFNYSDWPNFHSCLCPKEMNFYWDGESSICNDLIYDCLDDLIVGKNFTSVNIIGTNTTTYPNYKYVHIMDNTYAIWEINTNPPGTFN